MPITTLITTIMEGWVVTLVVAVVAEEVEEEVAVMEPPCCHRLKTA